MNRARNRVRIVATASPWANGFLVAQWFFAVGLLAASAVALYSRPLVASGTTYSTEPTVAGIEDVIASGRPVASAGPNRVVGVDSTVVLDGSESRDAKGGELEYSWVQLAGPRAMLDGNSSPAPSFVARQIDATYIFLLTVRNEAGLSYSDTVTVTVREGRGNDAVDSVAGVPEGRPVASAGPNQVVMADSVVVLDGSESRDTDGGDLQYSWVQLEGPKVTLDAEDAPAPSFMADQPEATYIFLLTVRNEAGLSYSDTVTISATTDTRLAQNQERQPDEPISRSLSARASGVGNQLSPVGWILLVIAIVVTLVSFYDLVLASFTRPLAWLRELITQRVRQGHLIHEGRVVDFKTGKPIWHAKIEALTTGSQVHDKATTDQYGRFSLELPTGVYTLRLSAPGFTLSPVTGNYPVQNGDVLYTGGTLHVNDPDEPLQLLVPLQPTGENVKGSRLVGLRGWQWLQQQSHRWSWVVFIVGSLFNTFLLFFTENILFLYAEFGYVALVFLKVLFESRNRPSHGKVRDAVTHVPLDLAVVRLYEQGTNRLVMTRVTDSQGSFFALPAPGLYRLVVTKQGYKSFSREGVEITHRRDVKLQIRADLTQEIRDPAQGPFRLSTAHS